MPIFRVGNWSSNRAFTLAELTIVLFLLSILIAMVYPKIRVGGDLRTVSRQLIGTIQHLSAAAESSKHIHRLHFDVTHGEYWATVAPSAARDDRSGAGLPAPQSRQAGDTTTRNRLPKNIRFAAIESLHLGRVLDGETFTQFFPIGRVEPTVIHLEDDQHETLSLSINPLTARVTVRSGLE